MFARTSIEHGENCSLVVRTSRARGQKQKQKNSFRTNGAVQALLTLRDAVLCETTFYEVACATTAAGLYEKEGSP